MVFLETPSHRDTGQPLDTVGHLTAIMSHSRLLSLYPGSVLDLLPAPQEAREEHAEQVEGTGGTNQRNCGVFRKLHRTRKHFGSQRNGYPRTAPRERDVDSVGPESRH